MYHGVAVEESKRVAELQRVARRVSIGEPPPRRLHFLDQRAVGAVPGKSGEKWLCTHTHFQVRTKLQLYEY